MMRNSKAFKAFRELLDGAKQMLKKFELTSKYQAELTVGKTGSNRYIRKISGKQQIFFVR